MQVWVTPDVSLVAVSNWQPGSLEGPSLFRPHGIFSQNRAYALHKCDHSFGNKTSKHSRGTLRLPTTPTSGPLNESVSSLDMLSRYSMESASEVSFE